MDIDALGLILVVDDDPTVCNTMLAVFETAKLTAARELSAREAKLFMEKNAVSLALVDVNMPGENGPMFANWISSHYPDTFIVLMSGELDPAKAPLTFPLILKGDTNRVLVEKVLLYMRQANYRRALLNLNATLSASVARLDERVLTLTVKNFMKEFLGDPIGKLVIGLVASIMLYAGARIEHLSAQASDLEATSRETKKGVDDTRQEMTLSRQEMMSLLRRIDRKQ